MKKFHVETVIMLFMSLVAILLYLYGVALSGTLYIPDWPIVIKNNVVGGIILLLVVGLLFVLLKTLYNIEKDKQNDRYQD